jgi:RNA polymerase sigma factor (sigma-70 family)
MTPQQEKSLLESIRSDPKQFGILFDQYYKKIFAYIYRRVTDYDAARDIAAETFLKAFLRIGTFQWKGICVGAWFYKIATNEVNYYFRKQRYVPLTFHSILDLETVMKWRDTGSDDEKRILEEELKLQQEFLLISEKLRTLDTKYQEVIALRYFENKDNREISAILSKPEGTIKSLLSRGLEKLRQAILVSSS